MLGVVLLVMLFAILLTMYIMQAIKDIVAIPTPSASWMILISFALAGTQTEIDAYQLAQEGQKKISELGSTCSAMCQSDFISNALGTNYTYPSKFPIDQFNLDVQCTGALNNPAGTFNIMCLDSTSKWVYVAHNATQLKQ